MNGDGDTVEISYREWTPGNALRFERSKDGAPRNWRVALHDAAPFVADVAGTEAPDLSALGAIAHTYLTRLKAALSRNDSDRLGLPPGWLDALEPPERGNERRQAPLRWLDVWPSFPDGEGAEGTPRLASWYLRRTTGDRRGRGSQPDEARIALVAAEIVSVNGKPTPFGLDFGLRVPLSIRKRDGACRVLIRSMTAELPHGPYLSLTEALTRLSETDAGSKFYADFDESLPRLASRVIDKDSAAVIAASLQLEPNLSFDDWRLIRREGGEFGTLTVEFHGKGVGIRRRGGLELVYSFSIELGPAAHDMKEAIHPGTPRTKVLSASATRAGEACIFVQDPPSWRDRSSPHGNPGRYDWPYRQVTRSEEVFERFRDKVVIGSRRRVTLGTDDFVVRNCPAFVPGDPDSMSPKQVDLPKDRPLPVRHNDFSAVSAYHHCREFFDMLARFGIDLPNFVVKAERAMQVFYRSGIVPGPGKDGKTINARVTIRPGNQPSLVANGSQIEMHLALGNLSHRARWVGDKPVRAGDAPGGTYAQPLGLAASKRWIWHELGHYLIAARFGRLEFDFVHSVGDALVAIMADPWLRLADPRGFGFGALDPDVSERFRGYTFPGVFTTRRHDRYVHHGWAWGGTLNRSLLQAPPGGPNSIKGYISEQILSSTLFRLYRILGGDSEWASGEPNFALRERGSLVALFLIVEAIRSLAQPPSAAEAFEAAMEDADTGLAPPLPLSPATPTDVWVGGRAHKAVRWAFEAQGMFPPDPDINHNAPGRAPPVDIYIPDCRPRDETSVTGSVAHSRGGYVPVSLDWDGERLWQADPAARSGTPMSIVVGNRGATPATGITLRAWVGIATGDPGQDGWDLGENIAWVGGAASAADGISVAAGGQASVEIALDPLPEDLAGGQALLLLVEATCPDDRANSDPAALRPTAIGNDPPKVPRHLTDLVANDNNLALWDLTDPAVPQGT